MATLSAETVPLPSRAALVRGVQGFILCSIVGIAVGLWWKHPAALGDLARVLKWEFVAALLPLIALDYFLGGLRYRMFFDGTMLPRISLWNCMRSNWANIFLGAATPFQTGGGPAQLYILWRCGARISDGVLVSLVNFATTLVFFLLSTIAAAVLLPHDLFGADFVPLLRTGFAVVGGVAGLVLLTLSAPRAGLALIRPVLRVIPWRSGKVPPLRERLVGALEAEAERFQEGFRRIVRRRPALLAATLVATLALFFNKYVMGYVIARALGQDVPIGIFIGLQIVQLFLIYFAPTPGASGVAELSSIWLLGSLMSPGVLLIYAIAWRIATTVLGAFIGAGVLLADLAEKAAPREPRPAPRGAGPSTP
jgi:glycosyltransferase 2 family protein